MKTTKELAWELGLLRKRKSSLTAMKKLKRTCQQFSHLIVMDFESTCWKDGKYRTQEIIEFPAVLLNTSSGEIESEFHYYVQPQENPVLSDFCRELTGISQDQVEQGISLSVCLKKFCTWLKTISEVHHFVYNHLNTDPLTKKCTFVTWSDWDLAVCLHYEAQRKQLKKPEALCSWIDLRATYRNFYDRKPKGLNGALQDLGIDFEGREHSGLHDSHNTANLAWRMMCDGCILKVTKSLSPALPSRNRTDKMQKGNLSSLVSPKLFQTNTEQSKCLHSKAKTNSRVLKCTSVSDTNVRKDFQVFEDKRSVLGMTSGCEVSPDSNNTNVLRDITNLSKPNRITPSCDRFKTPSSMKELASCNRSTERKDSKFLEKPAYKTNLTKQNGSVSLSSDRFKTPSSVGTKSLVSCSHSIERKDTKHLKNPVFKTPDSLSLVEKTSETGSKNPENRTVSLSMKTPDFGVCRVNSCGLSRSVNSSVNTSRFESKQTLKKTPPMCECGRRAVRKFVQSPGPNMGRVFFCCPLGRSTGQKGFGKVKQGCRFFKFEVESSASPFGLNSKSDMSCASSASSSTVCYKNPRKPSLPQPNFNTPNDNTRTSSFFKSSQKKTLGIKKAC